MCQFANNFTVTKKNAFQKQVKESNVDTLALIPLITAFHRYLHNIQTPTWDELEQLGWIFLEQKKKWFDSP